METLKYTSGAGTTCNMSTVPGNNSSHHQDSEVDSLLLSSCWAQNSNMKNEYLIDSNSMILDETMSSLASDKLLLDSSLSHDSEIATKATMDALDSLLLNSQPISTNLAELKPLPPFTGYTGHLSINGIRGHHYHAIAQSIPEENNNTYNSYSSEQNIVSSSTCSLADSQNLQNADSSAKSLYGVDDCGGMSAAVSPADSVSGIKLEYNSCVGVNPDSCMNVGADSVSSHVKSEMENYDISSLDIAAIIGSAIADTTVPNNNQLECDDPTASRDSWMDLESWIDGACVDNTVTSQKNIIITTHDGLSEFVLPHSPQPINVEYSKSMNSNNNNGSASTLQSLLTQNYMPLLQNRLQNGPPVKPETPSSTSYGIDMISTSSPPGNVVSTTDSVLLNGRYIQQTHYGVISGSGLSDRMQSPDMLGQNYPHTTTTTNITPKKSRSRSQKKQQQQHHQSTQQQQQQATSSTVFQSEQSLGLLGKEKPVHRCNICNRGFLNKSNIKVHLRTHTGEKPFRCDTCAKAFRQKAHLIKHQQIHKRIGRD